MKIRLFIKENKLASLIFSLIVSAALATPGQIRKHNERVILRHDLVMTDLMFKSRVLNYIMADSAIKARILQNHIQDSTNLAKNMGEVTAVKKSLTGYWTAKKEFDQVIIFQQSLLDELKKNGIQ